MVVTDNCRSIASIELLCYAPNECLREGIHPGGWDFEKVVPAFDPQRFSPEEIKDIFDFGDDRTLVRIVGDSAGKFMERRNSDGGRLGGIYGSPFYVPAKDIERVEESRYSAA